MKEPQFYSGLSKENKYITRCCFFVYFVTGIYAMSFGSLLPLLSSEYGLSDTVSGAIVSAHQLGNLLAGFFGGILPIYLGRKKSIIFLLCFVILGFSVVVLTGNPLLLILGFLFTGISRGSANNFNNIVVNELSDSSPSALNLLHATFASGALLAPLLVMICKGSFGNNGGWRADAVILIVLSVMAVLFFFKIEIGNFKKADKGKNEQTTSPNGFLKEKIFWSGVGILFFYLGGEVAIHSWIVKYFTDLKIMSGEYALMVASLLWAVVLVGRITCAFLGDRIPINRLLLIQSLGMIAFYILLLSTKNLTIITAAIIGLGFSMGGIYPTTISAVGKTLKSYPVAMGVLLIITGAGPILMPTITGALSDHYGIHSGMSAIVVAIILMLVCVIIMYKQGNEENVQSTSKLLYTSKSCENKSY